MHRKSTDLEYYRDKKLVIDADGVEVTLPLDPLDSSAVAEIRELKTQADASKSQADASATAAKGYRDDAKRSADGAASSLTLAK